MFWRQCGFISDVMFVPTLNFCWLVFGESFFFWFSGYNRGKYDAGQDKL